MNRALLLPNGIGKVLDDCARLQTAEEAMARLPASDPAQSVPWSGRGGAAFDELLLLHARVQREVNAMQRLQHDRDAAQALLTTIAQAIPGRSKAALVAGWAINAATIVTVLFNLGLLRGHGVLQSIAALTPYVAGLYLLFARWRRDRLSAWLGLAVVVVPLALELAFGHRSQVVVVAWAVAISIGIVVVTRSDR